METLFHMQEENAREHRKMLIFLPDSAVLVQLFGYDEHFIFVCITALMLMLTLEQERQFIRQRQREGIEAARKNGVHLGRKAMERPENYEEVKLLWRQGELSGRQAAEVLGVAHTTFRRWVENDEYIQ